MVVGVVVTKTIIYCFHETHVVVEPHHTPACSRDALGLSALWVAGEGLLVGLVQVQLAL